VKKKPVWILGCLAALVAAYVVAIVPSIRVHREWDRTVAAIRRLPRERVDAAVQAFLHDKVGTAATRPTTVTFAELVSGGYLHTNEVAAFGGKPVVVFTRLDDSNPAATYLLVPLTDTRDLVEQVDGSVMLRPRL
jgi:hypothetical protein